MQPSVSCPFRHSPSRRSVPLGHHAFCTVGSTQNLCTSIFHKMHAEKIGVHSNIQRHLRGLTLHNSLPISVQKDECHHNSARLLHQRSHADDITFADGFGQSHQQLFLLSPRLVRATLLSTYRPTALLGIRSWHCCYQCQYMPVLLSLLQQRSMHLRNRRQGTPWQNFCRLGHVARQSAWPAIARCATSQREGHRLCRCSHDL